MIEAILAWSFPVVVYVMAIGFIMTVFFHPLLYTRKTAFIRANVILLALPLGIAIGAAAIWVLDLWMSHFTNYWGL